MSVWRPAHGPNDASSTYAVIPMSGLAALEEPLPLVARDDLVKEPLLGTRVVQVVVDDLVAECLARHGTRLERLDCLPERRRHARQALGDEVVDHYLNYAHTEQRLFDQVVTSYERERMFERG